MRRALSSAASGLLALSGLLTACGGPPSAASLLQTRLLSAADLPAGWSAAPVNPAEEPASAPCLAPAASQPAAGTYATAAFARSPAVPSLGEVLLAGTPGQQEWQRLNQALANCRTATITIAGRPAPATVKPIAFPRVGSSSRAYALTFTYTGMAFTVDLITFDAGPYAGYVTYYGLGIPLTATVRDFADAAAAKAARGSTARVPDSVSVTSEPVRSVLTTSEGTIAYREIGSGPPLVLIMGYGGTMSSWDPRFVDALAQAYTVVIFDNPGIGGTSALPGPLSIDAMADETGALITALGLGQTSVLGWSMGSLIAQALAVRHPDEVSSLVLCATYPGAGLTVGPSPQAVSRLSAPDQQTATGALFPARQAGAENAYLTAISGYPPTPPVPAAVIAAQRQAVDAWRNGRDPAAQQTGTIAVPTLIADGSADLLDPLANSWLTASLIAGAKVMLYPQAGHAFLFQDEEIFAPAVVSFLTVHPMLAASRQSRDRG
ncbi:MAG TPA: alpha/beta fold hydrolase [Trebonia sp.]|nr:alpha/beta fold hydrolase [Trebonia sp.]